MHWTGIVTIILVSIYLLFMLVRTIRKIRNGESLEECSCAPKKGKGNALVEAYHAKYGASKQSGSNEQAPIKMNQKQG